MATKVIHKVVRTDDLGGAGKASPVRFSLNGAQYEIDLNKRNAATMERHLGRYVQAARPIGSAQSGSGRAHSTVIREWAAGQGIQVNSRGRIPMSVVEAYNKAQEPSEA